MNKKFTVFKCSDGILVWYGERGPNQKITYVSYTNENYQFKEANMTAKELAELLKSKI